MKTFIALLTITLAVAAHGSYVPSAWTANSLGWNSWNGLNSWSGLNSWNGLNKRNSWNDHSIVDTPYVNSWPAASLKNGWNGLYAPKTTVIQSNIGKVNPWELQWGGYGHGYNNYLGAAPVAKYVTSNPGSVLLAPLAGHTLNPKLIVA